ncbi:uncharacterized protein LOC106012156 [Aplysia californica]|uniref:Uncharacterized protein LOC106012156 n=1 Tax=Aplysia californica TaxID=6500 RepID=A0ABM1A2Q2_APLCA|nr:uncharacterized protein LOC106012156 [Aplysia californica]
MEKGRMVKRRVCEVISTRFSYAIPLEVVYLTPLLSWNPYNLTIREEPRVVNAKGRNGKASPKTAYDGVDGSHYFLTPIHFYKAYTNGADLALHSLIRPTADGRHSSWPGRSDNPDHSADGDAFHKFSTAQGAKNKL